MVRFSFGGGEKTFLIRGGEGQTLQEHFAEVLSASETPLVRA